MHWSYQYFKPQELLSEHGMSQLRKFNLMLNPRAIEKLVTLRKLIDKPIIINTKTHSNRGYRSVSENKNVGGSYFSRHVQGIAFDCTPKDMELIEFAAHAIRQGWGAVGLYNSFVHIDDRYKPNDIITFWWDNASKTITIDFKKIYLYTISELKDYILKIIEDKK